MGGVGHEVAADLLDAAALRDVVEGEHGAVGRALHAREGPAHQRVDAPQMLHLHLRLAALAGAQDVLHQRRHLALAHDLQVVAARGIAQGEAAAEALVGEEHDPLVVHGQHAVLHGGEDRLGARPLPRDLGEPRLELVRGAVQDPRQLAHLVRAVHARARGRGRRRRTGAPRP